MDFGSAGGESYQQLVDRLKAWLAELKGDIVVVTHGGVGRALLGMNRGLPLAEIPSVKTPANDRVYRLWRGTEAAL